MDAVNKLLNLIGYHDTETFSNRILYVMVLCSIMVAGFFLTVYFLAMPFVPAIVVHIIYILFNISLYWFLKLKRYLFVKISIIVAHFIQLTLAVFLWFPVQTGYNLYYFMIPMTVFLIMDYGNKNEHRFALIASLVSTLMYFLTKVMVLDFYYYETSEQMNRLLGGTSVFAILIPMTYIFAYYASDRYKSHKQLNLLANTDYLTGAFNRRVLFEKGKEAIDRTDKDKSAFSLLVMDIDYFKKINDQYGHPVGDEILRQLAELIDGYTRNNDIFARYGGEEFAILLPDTTVQSASAYADGLLTAIRSRVFFIDDLRLRVTVSIGIVEYEAHFHEFRNVMKAADEALYIAKDHGRNQVVAAPH